MRKKKKKKKKKFKPGRPERHHIIPSSRGCGGKNNIAMVETNEHKFYHQLFVNRTPVEILTYLVENFWGGKWRYLIDALAKAGKMY